MKKYIQISWLFSILLMAYSCSLEPTVADQESFDEIRSEETLRTLMDGAYFRMADYRYYGRNFIIAGELADNVYSTGNSNKLTQLSRMGLNPNLEEVVGLFSRAYTVLSGPNTILNFDVNSIEANQDNLNHVLGEAYTIRALVHFDLLRFYGQYNVDEGTNLGVSYITEFKGEEGHDVSRGTIEENKKMIYEDIEKAISHFEKGMSSSAANSKTNLTLDAAYALKSRVGTYFKEYDVALEGSEKIVDKYPITPPEDIISYWENDAPGAASIFELDQNRSDGQGFNGLGYIYRGDEYGDIAAFPNLLEDIGFEDDDIRASEAMIAIDNKELLRNMAKYPGSGSRLGADNIVVFRIEEIVLNHAESLLDKDPDEARVYINKILSNRNVANLYTGNLTIDDILSERRKELLFEGFRFHDLKRFNKDMRDINSNTPNNHGLIPAGSNKFAFPIPFEELVANKSSAQNPGYASPE